MIARRKVAFLRLCALLRSIEADLDDLDAVRALNLGVLKEILNDEGHIRRLRALVKDLNRRLKTERPSKAEAQGLAYGVPHRDCLGDLNACIQNARRDGWNAVCPEKGLAYMATFTGRLPDGFLESLNMTRPIVFTPNGDKMDHTWAPYLPFTSSIRDLQDLYDFAAGNLYLVVAVDAAVVCDRLSIPGWRTSLIDDPDRIILMEHVDSGAKIAISTQFFGRLGLEFMSLDWFVEHETEFVLRLWSEMMAGRGPLVDVAEVGDWGAQLEAAPRLYQAKVD